MQCTESQPFAGNANPFYKGIGLKGHTGIDIHCGYGSFIDFSIANFTRAWCYKRLDKQQPANDGSGFWGAFFIIEKDGQYFEWLIGHCSQIYVGEDMNILTPDRAVAAEGNRGKVFEGTIEITKQMQDSGDIRGSHRHFQKRLLERTKEKNGTFITGFGTTKYQDSEGYFYRIPNYNNGYNGCVDCADELSEYENWKTENRVSIENKIERDEKNNVTLQALILTRKYLFETLPALIDYLKSKISGKNKDGS